VGCGIWRNLPRRSAAHREGKWGFGSLILKCCLRLNLFAMELRFACLRLDWGRRHPVWQPDWSTLEQPRQVPVRSWKPEVQSRVLPDWLRKLRVRQLDW
jgi:hypothetical protein